MLTVRTPGAPQSTRVSVGCGSAFPFTGQGRLLRSRSISGLCSRLLSLRPATSLSTLRSGRCRPTTQDSVPAARYALPRPSFQTIELNALARHNPHRPVRAQLRHTVPTSSRRQLCLPYAVERLCHANPALCPVRALLFRVPLGPRPWLRRLRCIGDRCRIRFVRRLRSYYGGVRLLTIVHHRLRFLTFPTRTRAARKRLAVGRP